MWLHVVIISLLDDRLLVRDDYYVLKKEKEMQFERIE